MTRILHSPLAAHSHAPSVRRWRAAATGRLRLAAVIAMLTLLAGCTGGEATGGRDVAASARSAAEAKQAQEATVIAAAQRQAAQYDFDAAVATLSTVDSDAAAAALQEVELARSQAVVWADNTTISHLFWHSLIVDPARAFGDPAQGAGFSQYMVTIGEFTKQLEQLYANGYVLVHPDRIAAAGPDGTMTPTPIVLPPGKTPLVISVDDVNYYEYMDDMGFADKLVVNDDGDVVNLYTDAGGTTSEGSYDVVPIVDAFIDEHPDFSYRGDKGTLAITGYNGVLGYRSSVTSYGDTAATQAEQQQAKVVADALAADGWRFASHTWGHIGMTTSGLGRITEDAAKWDAEVRPIIGDTPFLIYPFGADIAGVEKYGPANAKFAFLHDIEGFRYYFNVDGSQQHWMQIGAQSVRQARINVDGITLQKAIDGSTLLTPFFDPLSTIDPARPLPVPLP